MLDRTSKVILAVVAAGLWTNVAVTVFQPTTAKADVAGMNYNELRRDRDFRRAVETIVDDRLSSCSVYVYDGENGGLSC